MQESVGESSDIIQSLNIRTSQTTIKTEIEKLGKQNVEKTPFDVIRLCNYLKTNILNYKDELHLTKTQNNHRRIRIASDLFLDLCSIHSDIIDFEYNKMITEILSVEKFKRISKMIKHRRDRENEREKYFTEEAAKKLVKLPEDEKLVLKVIEKPTEMNNSKAQLQLDKSKKLIEIPQQEVIDEESVRKISADVSLQGNLLPNITEIRAEHSEDISFQVSGMNIPRRETMLPENPSEILIRDQGCQTQITDDLNQFLQILSELEIQNIPQPDSLLEIQGDVEVETESVVEHDRFQEIDSESHKMNQTQVTRIGEKEKEQQERRVEKKEVASQGEMTRKTVAESLSINLRDIDEKETSQDGREVEEERKVASQGEKFKKFGPILLDLMQETRVDDEKEIENTEELAERQAEASQVCDILDPLNFNLNRLKHSHLIIDKETYIPDYAKRAVKLNKKMKIERVQVFEGPPTILQAMSTEFLMRTPRCGHLIPQNRRAEVLNNLQIRHMIQEQKPHQPFLRNAFTRTGLEQRKDVSAGVPRLQIEEAVILEENGAGIGMHMEHSQQRVLLSEVVREQSQPDLNITLCRMSDRESLIGMPLSRVFTSTPVPVDLEKINSVPSVPFSRISQLQGKSLDPSKNSSWFYSSKKNPPDPKWTEFKFVMTKLQELWTLAEIDGQEKCTTVKNILLCEGECILPQYLALLRIVDKLSLQKKVVLEHKNEDVTVKPFEIPYVSEKQFALRHLEPKF